MHTPDTETREERRARHRRELQEHADRVYAAVEANMARRAEEAAQLALPLPPTDGCLFVALPLCDCGAANYDSCICGENIADVEDLDHDDL